MVAAELAYCRRTVDTTELATATAYVMDSWSNQLVATPANLANPANPDDTAATHVQSTQEAELPAWDAIATWEEPKMKTYSNSK